MSRSKATLFELRSGAIDAVHLVVKTPDFAVLAEALQQRFDAAPEFFSGEAVAIDLRRLADDATLPLDELAALLRRFKMRPFGVVAQAAQQTWAGASDLPLLDSRDVGRDPRKPAESAEAATAPATTPAAAAPGAEPQAAAQPSVPAATPAQEPAPATLPTVLIDRPLRSGQRIYSPGDLIVQGVVSHGAEVMAEGHVHIYGALRGRALAGARGNANARIFCTSFEPELVAIAGIYRTAEQDFPAGVRGKPTTVRLQGEQLLIEPLALK
ncbi:MAG: septum site-determining protein MinC [Thiomonas arsenitoxydans]|uniref:Probable septum site-determining protein MinC n=1 Tax=Thiomonas arsenitoxydans (strain DSM 22701 / CIP 110005 / 3As) TaxID=426114 RepID=A0A8I1MYE1_THIA3|nr:MULTISPECIES: septum site-determining protein MinC [Thiomonas]MBN8745364.1 septum site-determining protein MinC [Thiomonas arsenitoxydans]ODU97600.1 MAG: septum site-determining protein MinC [Thiomonas sp. SCN 64-16]